MDKLKRPARGVPEVYEPISTSQVEEPQAQLIEANLDGNIASKEVRFRLGWRLVSVWSVVRHINSALPFLWMALMPRRYRRCKKLMA